MPEIFYNKYNIDQRFERVGLGLELKNKVDYRTAFITKDVLDEYCLSFQFGNLNKDRVRYINVYIDDFLHAQLFALWVVFNDKTTYEIVEQCKEEIEIKGKTIFEVMDIYD